AKLLKKEGIHAVFRRSSQGQLYGITYIDHTTKNVFNGSSLGKQYSAKAIEEHCGLKIAGEEKRNQIYEKLPSKESLIDNLQLQKDKLTFPDLVKVLDMLMKAEYSSDYLPQQLKNKRRKKRRGYLNL
ncbi:MAG TPA: relaxase, partial [Flavobacterium sp.]|nr:relaxase [Flavobacterium sp.]